MYLLSVIKEVQIQDRKILSNFSGIQGGYLKYFTMLKQKKLKIYNLIMKNLSTTISPLQQILKVIPTPHQYLNYIRCNKRIDQNTSPGENENDFTNELVNDDIDNESFADLENKNISMEEENISLPLAEESNDAVSDNDNECDTLSCLVVTTYNNVVSQLSSSF